MTQQAEKWYRIEAKAEDSAEIFIYGDIGDSWLNESVTAKQFVTDLQSVTAKNLTIRINSFGGAVADALAIHNAIKRKGAATTCSIDGVAMSAASLIAMAGDTVEMAENAILMIHAPMGACWGNAGDMREYADLLDGFADAMTSSYMRDGITKGEVQAWLKDGEDHYFTAEEAKSAKLIDVITGATDVAATYKDNRFTARKPNVMARGETQRHHREVLNVAEKPEVNEPEKPVAAPVAEAPSAQTQINVQAAIDSAISAERERVAAITARCAEFNMSHLAAGLIKDGASASAVDTAILNALKERNGCEISAHLRPEPESETGVNPAEIKAAYSDIMSAYNAIGAKV